MNVSGNSTYIESANTNDIAGAYIFVTPNVTASNSHRHPIGVWYDTLRRRWAIFNQDLASMPLGASFNIAVFNPSDIVTVIRASSPLWNSVPIFLSNSLYRPHEVIFATANYNPGGVGGVYNNHPTGVFYNPGGGWWNVFNQRTSIFDPDPRNMQVGASFNVIAFEPREWENFTHVATYSNIVFGATVIDNPGTNYNPDAILMMTQNWNPDNAPAGVYNRNNPAVLYNPGTGRWVIINQDSSPIPVGAAFNIKVLRAAGPN